MKHRTRGIAIVGSIALALTVASCSSDDSTSGGSSGQADGSDQVTISVMGLPAATNEASREAFLADVEAFEEEHPNITIEPTDEQYDSTTFATQLAGGQVQTVVVVPFTEPAALIERGQVSDISNEVDQIDGLGELNPAALGVLQRDDGLYGLPMNVYALGLVYNRDLFERAGLDPDDPPQTWQEVREAAAAIHDATGVAGFGSMTTEAGGGWQLTAQTVASGGEMQIPEGDSFTSNVDNEATREILQWQHALRWEDQSIGSTMLRNQQDIERAFASGEVAMVIATPSYYNRYINQYDGTPESFGVTSMPQADGANQTLIGGTALVVPSSASPEERAAAVEWINYEYVHPKLDTETAAEQAEAEAADGVAVGVPLLPLFNEETQAAIDEAIAPHVNIDLDHFEPYIEGVKSLELVAEPPLATQEIYSSLDAVVQEVLTEEGADIDALLSDADANAQSLIANAG